MSLQQTTLAHCSMMLQSGAQIDMRCCGKQEVVMNKDAGEVAHQEAMEAGEVAHREAMEEQARRHEAAMADVKARLDALGQVNQVRAAKFLPFPRFLPITHCVSHNL